jgi:hypothetical protein
MIALLTIFTGGLISSFEGNAEFRHSGDECFPFPVKFDPPIKNLTAQ